MNLSHFGNVRDSWSWISWPLTPINFVNGPHGLEAFKQSTFSHSHFVISITNFITFRKNQSGPVGHVAMYLRGSLEGKTKKWSPCPPGARVALRLLTKGCDCDGWRCGCGVRGAGERPRPGVAAPCVRARLGDGLWRSLIPIVGGFIKLFHGQTNLGIINNRMVRWMSIKIWIMLIGRIWSFAVGT